MKFGFMSENLRQAFIKFSQRILLYSISSLHFSWLYSLYDRLISNRVSKYIFNNLLYLRMALYQAL